MNEMNNENNINNGGYTPQQSNPTFTKYLILSILELICCCPITGIIALVFTIMANSAFNSSNMNTYNQYTKYSKVSLIVGVVLAILSFVFAMLSGVLSLFLNF